MLKMSVSCSVISRNVGIVNGVFIHFLDTYSNLHWMNQAQTSCLHFETCLLCFSLMFKKAENNINGLLYLWEKIDSCIYP